MRRELDAVLDRLSADSIAFLKQQADVLLHNKSVKKSRQEALERAERRRDAEEPDGDGDAGEQGSRETKRGGNRRDEAPKTDAAWEVTIRRTGESSFFVYAGKRHSFFSREEMRQLARICHAAGSAEEAVPRLYRWFERERQDFINDMSLSKRNSPTLQQLYNVIVTTYKAPS